MRFVWLLFLIGCSEPVIPLIPMETTSVCGNGIVEGGEACDEAGRNGSEQSRCNLNCTLAGKCGDGVLDRTETCDDGPLNGSLRTRCNLDCTSVGSCGDAVVDRTEECDEGPRNSATRPGACRPTCILAGCNDGVLDPEDACIGRMYWDGQALTFAYRIPDRNGDGIDEVWAYARGGELDLWTSRGHRYVDIWTIGRANVFSEADIDSDGLLDLMQVYTSSAVLWRGVADGTFVDPVDLTLGTDVETYGTAELADFGADGRFELVVVGNTAESSDWKLFVYALGSNGLERLGVERLPSSAGFSWNADSLDIDGDGDLDLLLNKSYGANSGEYFWMRVDPLEAPIALPELGAATYLYEIELDGAPPTDFAFEEDGVTRFISNRGGRLEDAGSLPLVPDFGDFDEDGVDEAFDSTGTGVDILTLPDGGLLRHVESNLPRISRAGLLWDQDGDGVEDLVAVSDATAEIFVRRDGELAEPVRWTFDGFFAEPFEADGDDLRDHYTLFPFMIQRGVDQAKIRIQAIERRLSSIVPIEVGDDAAIDVLTLAYDGTFELLLGTGNGFADPIPLMAAVDAFAIGDFDGDGLVDAAVAIPGVGIAHGLPGGQLAAPASTATVGTIVEMLAADVTGDGSLDVVYRTASHVGVLIGEALSSTEMFAIGADSSIAAADLDGDGDTDLVARNNGSIELFVGGPAGLARGGTFPTSGERDLVLVDANRDGVRDAVTINEEGLIVTFGARGGFGSREERVAVDWGAERMLVGDVSGDGWNDIVTTRTDSGSIIINTARGFELKRTFGFRRWGDAEALADIDRDGALDLISAVDDSFPTSFDLGPPEIVVHFSSP